jgi:nitroreductase family protein
MNDSKTSNAGPAAPSLPEIESMIESAVMAPSADNNQPWYFHLLDKSSLGLCHDTSRALPSDVNRMFDMIALGAATENLAVAASQYGWKTSVEFLQGSTSRCARFHHDLIARISFSRGGAPDPLFPFLPQRATCRKAFRSRPVPKNKLEELGKDLDKEMCLYWETSRSRLWTLAWLVAAADRIRFEHRAFHEELFKQMRFSVSEAEASRDGLDVRCLELPPPAIVLLKMLRPWPLMKSLNRLGFSRALTWQSAVLLLRTGAVGILTTSCPTPEGHFRAGRALQRIWLKASSMNLAFHPMGSIPIYLSRFTQSGKVASDSSLAFLARQFHRAFSYTRDQGVVLLFRLGEAVRGSVHSLRRPVAEVFSPVPDGSCVVND